MGEGVKWLVHNSCRSETEGVLRNWISRGIMARITGNPPQGLVSVPWRSWGVGDGGVSENVECPELLIIRWPLPLILRLNVAQNSGIQASCFLPSITSNERNSVVVIQKFQDFVHHVPVEFQVLCYKRSGLSLVVCHMCSEYINTQRRPSRAWQYRIYITKVPPNIEL